MNLCAPTDEGHRLRCNLLRLLCSYLPANYALGTQLMEGAGVPLVALPWLRGMVTMKESNASNDKAILEREQLQALLRKGMDALPEPLRTHLLPWMYPEQAKVKSMRLAWQNPRTFELAVELGLLTWAQWADYWDIDPFFLYQSCLTLLLMDRGLAIDREEFLSRIEAQPHTARQPWLGLLMDRLDQAQQLRVLKCLAGDWELNLSGTGLSQLPEVTGQLQGVTQMDIGGTAISRLPKGLLEQVHTIKGKRRQVLAIQKQAWEEGSTHSALRLRHCIERGCWHHDRQELREAYPYCASGMAAFEGEWRWQGTSRIFFAEACTDSGIEVGDWEMALSAIRHMGQSKFIENPVLRWKGWGVWRGLITIAGMEEPFVEVLSTLGGSGRYDLPRFVGLSAEWAYDWAWVFENLILHRSMAPALRLLEQACKRGISLRMSQFRWDRILSHLHQTHQEAAILQLFDYLDKPDSGIVPVTPQDRMRDPRSMALGHKALRQAGFEAEALHYRKVWGKG